MVTETSSSAPGTFMVVFWCSSGARVRPCEKIQLHHLPTDSRPVDVTLTTRYEDLGFAAEAPRELMIEVSCQAESVDEAQTISGPVASGIAAIVSFDANVTTGSPRMHVAIDASPGRTRREFAQAFHPTERGLTSGRMIDAETFIAVLSAIHESPHHARLARALSQYDGALRSWNTGGLVMVLAHLYMGAEALTPSVERLNRERLGVTEEEHATSFDIDVEEEEWRRLLLARARRKYIFNDEHDLYNRARKASDGFEHGFEDLPKVRAAATDVCRRLFDLLRSAILDVLDLPSELRARIAERHPVDISALWREIRGHLSGNVKDLSEIAAGELPYPALGWTAAIQSLQLDGDTLSVTVADTFTHTFSEGVAFEPGSHAVYGGMNPAQSPKLITGSAQTQDGPGTPAELPPDGNSGQEPQGPV